MGTGAMECTEPGDPRFPAPDAFLAGALKGLNVGTWRFDISARTVDWDDVAGKVFGRPGDQSVPLCCLPIHPDDRGPVEQAIDACIATGEALDVEFRLRHDDGSESSALTYGALSEGMSPRWVTGILVDTTARRLAEKQAEDSRRTLRNIIDNLPGVVYRCGLLPPWKIEFISEAAEDLTGYPAAAFLSGAMTWQDIILPDDRAMVAEQVAQAIAANTRFELRYRIVSAAGETRWVFERGRATFEDGHPRQIEGFIGDIHDSTIARAKLHETEERYRLASRATRDLVWDWELGSDALEWNEAPGTSFGYAHDALGRSGAWWQAQIHPDDIGRVRRKLRATLEGEGNHFLCEYRFRCRDGSYAQVFDRGYVIRDSADQPVRMVGAMQDLTENRSVQAALKQSETINQSILSASADCIMIIAADGAIELMNEPGIQALELQDVDHVRGQLWVDLWPRDARESVCHALQSAIEGTASRFTEYCPTARGTPKWWDVVVTPMQEGDGRPTRLLAICRDVTAIRYTTEQLQWSSEHDALTGLPNRRAFEAQLAAVTRDAVTGDRSLGLLLIDLDHFKHVNDTLGHQAGDFLLMSFAERLLASVRKDDFVARLGGDEFAVILANTAEADLLRAGASILERLQDSVRFEGRVISASASIGGALFPRDAKSAHDLFKNADTALFALKSSGRGGTRMFHGDMREQMHSAASQIGRARQSIAGNLIRPYYQPKVDLASGRIVGFEALLRLHGRDHRLGYPAEIAEAFKDYELAAGIGQHMQSAVIADMAGWRAAGLETGRISVNAAPAEFLRDDYAERLLGNLERAGVATAAIEIEVTEQVFVERGVGYVKRALHALHDAGVRIALDDFGTGYSSLSHLRDFPVDVVKVDRSFVEQVLEKPEIAAIVRAVTNLCRSLGLEVVAEGIETPEQATKLIGKGCSIGQGYLFGRPIPAQKVPDLLRQPCPVPHPVPAGPWGCLSMG